MIKSTTFILSLAALICLAACNTSLLPKGPPAPRLFVLNAAQHSDIAKASEPLPMSMEIVQPLAAPGLDSERIATLKDGQEMNYISGAHWSGPLPAVVGSQLVDMFNTSHALKTVASDLVQFHFDYMLVVDIRAFEIEYNGATATKAHVRLVTRLIQASNNTIIATNAYEESEAIKQNNIEDMVTAINTAFARASNHLVGDVTKTLADNAGIQNLAAEPEPAKKKPAGK